MARYKENLGGLGLIDGVLAYKKKPLPNRSKAASGELLGLACGLTVCWHPGGGAPSSKTTEP